MGFGHPPLAGRLSLGLYLIIYASACATGAEEGPPPVNPPADADVTPDADIPDAMPECTSAMDCDDGNVCNGAESCEAGACVPGVMQMDGLLCDDGNLCTTSDACMGGVCSGEAMDCSMASDMCNAGVCDPMTGMCAPMPVADGTECNDEDACTVMDVCTAGVCAGGAMDCSALTDMCNTGSCDAMTGECAPIPVMDGTMCDDGDAMTIEDMCSMGVCAGRPPWSGIRTFSNCSQTGATGPSQAQCDTAYRGGTLMGEVTVTSGLQRWTVPATGMYRIEAWGAQGHSAQSGQVGGNGARIRGDFMLTMGQQLDILVGQAGQPGTTCNGAGGGGSFVVDVTMGTPLIVAGGGAGTRSSVTHAGCPGRIVEAGGSASGSGSSHDCSGDGTAAPQAGGRATASSWGSGGAGFTGAGAIDGTRATAAAAYTSGGEGGTGVSCETSIGGFGGGGSGNGCCGGGGGGGYTGGEGGRVAGGGGSFNSGASPDNSDGCGGMSPSTGCSDRSGHGQVTIDLL